MRSPLLEGRKTMTNSWRFKMLGGTACLLVGLAITYACSDFLNTPAQGTLDVNALSTRAGVATRSKCEA